MARKKKRLPRNVAWDAARGQYYVTFTQKCRETPPEGARVKRVRNRSTGALEAYVLWQHYTGPELRDATRYRNSFRKRMGWDVPRVRRVEPTRIPTVQEAWVELAPCTPNSVHGDHSTGEAES